MILGITVCGDVNTPPQLNSARGRIFTLDKCTNAKITPINESSTFHGAGRGAKSAEETYKKIRDTSLFSRRPESEFR